MPQFSPTRNIWVLIFGYALRHWESPSVCTHTIGICTLLHRVSIHVLDRNSKRWFTYHVLHCQLLRTILGLLAVSSHLHCSETKLKISTSITRVVSRSAMSSEVRCIKRSTFPFVCWRVGGCVIFINNLLAVATRIPCKNNDHSNIAYTWAPSFIRYRWLKLNTKFRTKSLLLFIQIVYTILHTVFWILDQFHTCTC